MPSCGVWCGERAQSESAINLERSERRQQGDAAVLMTLKHALSPFLDFSVHSSGVWVVSTCRVRSNNRQTSAQNVRMRTRQCQESVSIRALSSVTSAVAFFVFTFFLLGVDSGSAAKRVRA